MTTLAKRVVAAPVAPVPATSSQPTPASGPELTPSASGPIPAAVPEVPAWALTIADELFRKALLHIEKHDSIDEAEKSTIDIGLSPTHDRTQFHAVSWEFEVSHHERFQAAPVP